MGVSDSEGHETVPDGRGFGVLCLQPRDLQRRKLHRFVLRPCGPILCFVHRVSNKFDRGRQRVVEDLCAIVVIGLMKGLQRIEHSSRGLLACD